MQRRLEEDLAVDNKSNKRVTEIKKDVHQVIQRRMKERMVEIEGILEDNKR